MSIVVKMTPEYMEMKAVELIHEAQQAITYKQNPEEYDSRIDQAISLLALAKVKRMVSRNGAVKKARPKKRTRSSDPKSHCGNANSEGLAHNGDSR